MPTYEAGTASVSVWPSMRNFHSRVRRDVERMPGFDIAVQPDTRGFGQRAQRQINAQKPTAQIDLQLRKSSVAKVEAEAKAASERIAAARRSEADAADDVRLAETRLNEVRARGTAKASDLVAAENKLASSKRRLEAAQYTVTDSTEQLAGAQKRLAARHAEVETHTRSLDSAFDRLGRHTLTLRDLDRSMSAAARTGARLATTMTLVAAGTAAVGHGVPAVASLGATLGTATQAALALPGALAAAVAAGSTLAVGAQGIGDAFDAASESSKATGKAAEAAAEKYNQALAELAPNAAAFVRSTRDMADEYEGLRRHVQNRLFAGLNQEITTLGQTYLPILDRGMGRVADGFNLATKRAAGFFTEQRTLLDMRLLFDQVGRSIDTASGGIPPMLRGFRDIGAVGASMLPELSRGFVGVTERFSAWTDRMRKSGELERMLREGIDALQDLGGLVVNTGSIVVSFFSAADKAGIGFVATARQATGQLRQFLSSTEGQTLLLNFFYGLKRAADAVTPGLAAIMRELGFGIADISPHLPGMAAGFNDVAMGVSGLIRPIVLLIPHLSGGFTTALTVAVDVLNAALTVLQPLMGFLGGMGGTVLGLAVAWKLLAGPVGKAVALFNLLRPATVASGLTSMADRLQGVNTAAVGAAGGVGQASTATGGLARTGGKASGVIGGLIRGVTGAVKAVPLLGAAYIGVEQAMASFVGSQDELTQKLSQGGTAALEANKQLRSNDATLKLLSDTVPLAGAVFGHFATTTDEAKESLRQQRAEMTAVERAQADLVAAQNRYQMVLDDHTSTIPEVLAAQGQLAGAADRVAQKQWEAEQATKTHTQRMQEQRNAILAGANADLAYEQNLLTIKDAQQRLTEARNQYGWSSDQAKQAEYDLQSAWFTSITLAGEAARAHNSHKSSVDQDKAATAAMNRETFRLANQLGNRMPQSLRDMIAAMSPAEARAAGFRVKTDRLGRSIVNIPKGPKITLKEKGIDEVQRKVDRLNASLQAFDDLFMSLTKKPGPGKTGGGALGPSVPRFVSDLMRAGGGPIEGSRITGTATSDSNVISASRGEHMWAASEVAGAGGHDQVEKLRGLAAAGLLPRFALGGQITPAGGRRPRRPVVGAAATPATAAGVAGTARDAAALDATAAGLTGTMGTLGRATEAYRASVTGLATTALTPLQKQINEQTVPAFAAVANEAGLRNVQAVTKLRNTLPTLGAQQVRTGQTTRTAWQQTTNRVVAGQNTMQQRQTTLASGMRVSWNNIATTTDASVSRQRRAYGGLQTGMGNTRRAMDATANTAVRAFSRVESGTKNPLRRTINQVINRGILGTYNALNRQFNFGRAIKWTDAAFAAGGEVDGPGTGTSDSICAPWVSDGEFVVRERVTRAVRPFLRALNAGEPEAMQAAGAGRYRVGLAGGGMVADTGSAANAAILRAVQWLRRQHGKPYIWGGVGPAGFDCSGLVSATTNVLRGENPHRRLGVARSQPWPGFERGLKGAWATGFSSGHTAATLAGVNVEAGGSPSRTKYGAGAAGADDPQFPGHAWLPFIGGRFVSGGGGFDPSPMIRAAFAKVDGVIRSINQMWPGNIAAQDGTDIAWNVKNGVQAAAIRKATEMLGVGLGAGDPRVRQIVQQVAAARGWGSGPQWAALDWIITRESGWNPNARNPTSSASGLFQKMVSVHGPLERTIRGQAQWGINYIAGRFGDPLGAKRFWESHGHYDDGGLATGTGFMLKNVIEPERTLDPHLTRSFDHLVYDVLPRGGIPVYGDDGASAAGPLIGEYHTHLYGDNNEARALEKLDHTLRVARRGGRYTS